MNPDRSAERPAGRQWAFSIGTWLALAAGAVLVVFLIGNFLAQRSTRTTTLSVSRVEHRFEPLVRLARELETGVGSFDRAVLSYLKFDTPENAAAVTEASLSLVAALAEYDRIGQPGPQGEADAALPKQIAEFHRDGLLLAELQNGRRKALTAHQAALDALRRRIAGAGATGLRVGDKVFALRSLAELALAAEAMRESAARQFAEGTRRAAADALQDENAFRAVLRAHAEELARSPGRAWLQLLRENFQEAATQRRAVEQLDAELEASRRGFAESASRLQHRVHADLQEPAWRALTEAARYARVTAQDAERMLRAVSFAILLVVAVVAATTARGVTAPVRRLTAGTRRLAAGALATRVPRGGVRELDQLAQAFNHMAEQLASSQQVVRTYQAELEDRVAERTRQLRHLANHDPLTELPNRRQLFAYLNTAIEEARAAQRQLAVLFIDLDNFKTINDSMGHEFGDRVLNGISHRLRSLAREGDFIARLGGDEFTLVLRSELHAADVEQRVNDLIAQFQRPLRIDQRDLLVGASIGVAVCPEHASDAESLLRAADAALFRAKELGRNRYSVHSPELLEAATKRFRTEQALRKAGEAGDLVLHFQPEVSLASLETVVAEALLRWRQPDGSLITAGQFLGIAEQSGLILDLNEWVLRSAGATLREWRSGPWPQARIAVNASAQQFLAGNFVTTVERLLRAADLPPECLELELTETVLQTGPATIDTLHSLRMLGVTVALDDFGTGYSSLTSLERLPLDRIKLDRSLISDVDTNPRSAAIARSIVSLCRSLGLQVTAEGVERLAQLEFLDECGGVHAQGYLIARPAAAPELLGFVAATRSHLTALRASAAQGRSQPALEAGGAIAVLRPRRG